MLDIGPVFRERLRQVWQLAQVALDRKSLTYSVIAIVLSVSVAIIAACTPIALKYLVDGFRQHSGAESAVLLVGLYVLGLWLGRVLGNLRSSLALIVEQRTSRSLSRVAFSHLLRLPLRFHMDRKTGAVSETLNRGVEGFQLIYQQTFTNLLPLTLELVTMCVVLSKLNQVVYIYYFLVALVLYAVAFTWHTNRQVQTNREFNAAHIDANAALTDGVMNCETIKCFSAEAVLGKKYDQALDRRVASWIEFAKSRIVNDLTMSTIYGSFVAATTLYAANAVQGGSMTVGDFVLIQAYALQLIRPVESVGLSVQAVFTGAVNLEKLLALLSRRAERLEIGRQSTDRGAPSLEFRNVRFAYREDYTTLRDVSFEVPAGKTLAIVGASGAGKSSLVRLLVRFFEPESGQILLNGVPISELPLEQLRRSISVVPQDCVLFDETIAFNIGIGSADSTIEEIEKATRLAKLHDYVMSLPQGLQTPVGERGVKLSGGERQRVAVARAAIRNPLIYVFDEATSSLDSRTEKEIMKNLRELARRSTTLIIAHRLSTVVHADRIIVLESGVVVEQGTHATLLALGGKYAALWDAQHGHVSTPAA